MSLVTPDCFLGLMPDVREQQIYEALYGLQSSASGGELNILSFGAVSDGETDNTEAIQAAINATPQGGTLLIPTGTFAVTSTLVIPKGITIRGNGVSPLFGDRSITGSDIIPMESPFLTGSVLLMTSANTNVIEIPVIGQAVNLWDFGIRFSDSIKFNSTGHGILAQPPAYLTVRNNGMDHSSWKNVLIYGTDGDHYAFSLTNAQLSEYENLAGYGGGGFQLDNDPLVAYGNSVWIQPYCCIVAGGTANGFDLRGTTAETNILNVFQRPQAFANDTLGLANTPPNGTQWLWFASDEVARFNVSGADMEETNSCTQGIRLPADMSGSFWSPALVPSGVGDKTYIGSAVQISGGAAGVEIRDRADSGSGTPWVLYSASNIFRIQRTADRLTLTDAGLLTTAAISLSDGSAGAPAIRWGTSGFFHSSGSIGMVLGGVNRVTLDPTFAMVIWVDGSAGSPSYVWAGDGDTGVFHAADVVGISTGGTERFRVNNSGISVTGTGTFSSPVILPTFTVATLPSAATFVRGLIYVSDGTANKRLAISDGTNWRFPDGAIVS